jgi:inosine/xanthosine triphosphate pyrophosphatase family protein
MQPAEKHALSHRGKALLKLIKFFAAPENRLWLDAKPQ